MRIIKGLAGTGKSKYIREEIKAFGTNQSVLYLTFNTIVADAFEKSVEGFATAKTFHSFCTSELNRNGILINDKTDGDIYEKIIEGYYELLFLNSDYNLNYDHLYLDEAQNIPCEIMEILKLICKRFTGKVTFVGDPNQSIYLFRKGNQNNLLNLEKEFDITEIITLTENFRSNSGIINLINNFITHNISEDSSILYSNKLDSIEKPKYFLLNNQEDQFDFVKKDIEITLEKEPTKSILILSRTNKPLKRYEDFYKENKNITVSSIHRTIGTEGKLVYLINFQEATSMEEKNVIYTALSRAKDKLVISSCNPNIDIEKIFGSSVEVEDSHTNKFKLHDFKGKKLRKENNLTLKKFLNTPVDSIALYVKVKDIPFIPYIEQEGFRNSFNKKIIVDGDVPVEIIKVKNRILFKFKDFNLLRVSDFSNKQILHYCGNYIMKYFGNQIWLDKIHLSKMDLAKIFHKEDSYLDKLKTVYSKKLKILKSNKRKSHEVLQSFSLDQVKDSTVYFNLSSSYTKNVTVAVYKPFNKECHIGADGKNNRYNNRDAIKVEVRMKEEYLKGKKVLQDKMTLDLLVNEESSFFLELFERVIEGFQVC